MNILNSLNSLYSYNPAGLWWLTPTLIWGLVWKGLALWRAARQNQRYWYIALLLINTVGLLEIAYLFYFSKPKSHSKKS